MQPLRKRHAEPLLMEYQETTRGITVTVRPEYLTDESVPEDAIYIWAYYIRIRNEGSFPVQLQNRYWKITDANGHFQEVRGPGVVGQQPNLQPGEMFEYSSGTHLPTSSGVMGGYYEMSTDDGERFMIKIPTFSLDSPEQLLRPN